MASASVLVDARPEPIRVDLNATALLVIDMQNDFASVGGMFDRAGVDISALRKVVEPTRAVLAEARQRGIHVIYAKMEHDPKLSDAGDDKAPHRIKHSRFGIGNNIEAPDGSEGRILVRNTWNTEIMPEVAPKPEDVVISKHRFSAFFETELDTTLKAMGIRYLFFTGCTTSVCVESTVRDAMFRDYFCIVLEDCTAEAIGSDLPRTNHDSSLLVIERLFGWVSDSKRFIRALRAA